MVKEITNKQEFDDAVKKGGLVIVDFFATWCGPCKMVAPLLDKFEAEYTSATFLKVDVDKFQEVAQQYEVSSMPTLLFFKDGLEAQRIVGVNPNALKQALTTLA